MNAFGGGENSQNDCMGIGLVRPGDPFTRMFPCPFLVAIVVNDIATNEEVIDVPEATAG